MKLLRTTLLIAFACGVCIALFLAGNLAPTLRFTGHLPSYDGPVVLLAADVTADRPEAAIDASEDTAAAEPSTFDAVEPIIDAPAAPNRAATYAAAADDNPIPEFLRGRDLPQLAAGEKVVTVQVPVDNWVDLSEQDDVQVQFEQAPIEVFGPKGSTLVGENLSLQVVAHAEIYAMPSIAPEARDTVPVCLTVSAKDARELLALRKNPGKYTLTVVKSARDKVATPSRDPIPDGRNRNTIAAPNPARTLPAEVDDFPIPVARPTPATGTGAASDATPMPARNPNADDFVPPTRATPTPVPAPSSGDEDVIGVARTLEPGPTPTPAAAAPAERPRPVPFPQEEDALPTIEPSEEGTVLALNGRPLQLALGATQIVECESRIQRVSGFDAKIIRVTPLTARRLKIEALAAGHTSFRVDVDDSRDMGAQTAPFSVEVQVQPPFGSPPDTGMADDAPPPFDRRSRERDEAEATLEKLYPNAGLEFVWLRDSLVLRGWVTNENEIPQIIEIAKQYSPIVHNQLSVQESERSSEPKGRAIGGGNFVMQIEPLNPEVIPELRAGVMVNLLRPAPPDKPGYVPPETVVENIEIYATPSPGSSAVSVIVPNPEHYDVVGQGNLIIKPIAINGGIESSGLRIVVVHLRQAISLRPRDRVDLYRLKTIQKDGKSAVRSEHVISNVEVLDINLSDNWHAIAIFIPKEAEATVREAAKEPLLAVLHGSEGVAIESLTAPEARLLSPVGPDGTPADGAIGSAVPLDTAAPDENTSDASLRYDIRALHDDVRKLITLLEQRQSRQSEAVPSEPPSAATEPEESEPGDPAAPTTETTTDFQQQLWDAVGMRVSPLVRDGERFRGTPYRGGLEINEVRPGSPTATAGIRAGDVLVGLHIWTTEALNHLEFAFSHSLAPLKFYVLRGQETLYGSLAIKWETAPEGADRNLGLIHKLAEDAIENASPLMPENATHDGQPDNADRASAAVRENVSDQFGFRMTPPPRQQSRTYHFYVGFAR